MPDNEITTYTRNDYKVIEVDTKRAKYQGIEWQFCSEYQKRKYENYLFLSNNNRDRIKFIYV